MNINCKFQFTEQNNRGHMASLIEYFMRYHGAGSLLCQAA